VLRFASIAAEGAILNIILTSNLSQLNDCLLNLTSFLSFVWWLHIAEVTLQTVKKTCNCRYEWTKYSVGIDKKRRYRRILLYYQKK